MIVNRESRCYEGESRIWVGKYINVNNLPHWHYDCEIVFVERGSATFCIDGKIYEVAEGGSVFIAPCATHQIRSEDEGTLSFFIFDCGCLNNIIRKRTLLSPLLSRDYRLGEIFSVINEELNMNSPVADLSANNRIERLALDIFMNENTEESKPEEKYMQVRYTALLKDIDENFANYTISDAARFASLSESYFSKFFKQMAGMTFTKYLNLVRVEKSIEMIRTSKDTMTKIAISCGFGTIRNFNRVFHTITGYSPRELPTTYNLNMHPSYGIEDTFNPTSDDSILL